MRVFVTSEIEQPQIVVFFQKFKTNRINLIDEESVAGVKYSVEQEDGFLIEIFIFRNSKKLQNITIISDYVVGFVEEVIGDQTVKIVFIIFRKFGARIGEYNQYEKQLQVH